MCTINFVFICNTGNNVEFGKQQIVQKNMKGIFHLRSSLPKYTFTWDVRKLLDYYGSQSNNNGLDLKVLTFKATILLTIILCQGAQTAYSLDLQCVKVEEDKIQIAFPSLLKQTRPGKHLKLVTLKSYKTDLKICPVNVLQSYNYKTKDIRRIETKFFISFLNPHNLVEVKKISRWIKEFLKTAVANVKHYQKHSLRSGGASAAKSNISNLLLTGGWCNKRTFAKFYKEPCNEIKQIRELQSNFQRKTVRNLSSNQLSLIESEVLALGLDYFPTPSASTNHPIQKSAT